jgi:hypothetical protein
MVFFASRQTCPVKMQSLHKSLGKTPRSTSMNNVPWQEVGFRVRYIRGYLLVPAECFNRGKRYPEQQRAPRGILQGISMRFTASRSNPILPQSDGVLRDVTCGDGSLRRIFHTHTHTLHWRLKLYLEGSLPSFIFPPIFPSYQKKNSSSTQLPSSQPL